MRDAGILRRCERFVYDEAELLDQGHFDVWLDLFESEAVYWLPVDTSRTEPRGGLNLIYDDRRRLEDRIRRLQGGFSHTEDPLSRTSHIVSNVRVLDRAEAATVTSWIDLDDDALVLTARTVIARTRRGNTDVFHGRAAWVLRDSSSGLTIRVKRVDLLGADQPLPSLTFLL